MQVPALLAAPLLWQTQNPDLFDSFTAGMILLQMGVPQVHTWLYLICGVYESLFESLSLFKSFTAGMILLQRWGLLWNSLKQISSTQTKP